MNKKHRVNTIDKSGNTQVNKTLILAILMAVLLLGTAAYILASVATINLFELDGNINGNNNISDGPDWGQKPSTISDGLFNATGATSDSPITSHFGTGGLAAAFVADPLSQRGPLDSSVFVGSNKNNDPISSWHWGSGNNQAKDEISNVYAYAAVNPTNSHLIIYSGLERISPSGDSHIDVEFFQSNVGLIGTTPSSGPQSPPCPGTGGTNCLFSGTRTVGDIIVSMDFTIGGTLGGVSIHRWDGSTYALVETFTPSGSAICNSTGSVCALNNGAPIPSGPWPTFDSHDNTITTVPTNGFTEFGVDITQEIGGSPCITTMMPKTRSSQSFTATLQDFGGPVAFPICSGKISIAPNATNGVGQPHTFTVTVSKTIAGTTTPVSGTPVTVKLTAALGANVTPISNTCASTNSTGQCTVTFTSPTAGTVTGHANATITIGTSSFQVATDGTNGNSGDAVKTFVDARIGIAPSATNEVNATHTFTVTVLQNKGDGAGFVNAPDGTKPTVTLTNGNGASFTNVVNNCASTGAVSGTCTVSFTSPTAGTVTGSATVTFSVQGVSITRSTGDGKSGDSGNAVKTFVDAFIAVSPLTATNSIQDNHTFTFTVQQNRGDGAGYVNAPDGTIVSVTLTGSNGANPVPNTTSCTISSGTCTVTFTSNTAGTVTVHGSVTFTISGVSLTRATGDGKSFDSPDAVKTFVAGSISWLKFDNNGNLLTGSTFTVCRTADNHADGTSTAITPICIKVTDGQSPDTTGNDGHFILVGLRLGNYSIQEFQAPPGFTPDPTIVQVSLTISSPNAAITTPFIDQRPILKLTGFGYQNTLTSTPSQCPPTCTVNGTVVYSITIHNNGTATGFMNLTFTVTPPSTGTFICTGGNTISLTNQAITAGGDFSTSKTCTYTNVTGGIATGTIDANLNATYNTGAGDTLIRTVNGSPAEIKFTVQSN